MRSTYVQQEKTDLEAAEAEAAPSFFLKPCCENSSRSLRCKMQQGKGRKGGKERRRRCCQKTTFQVFRNYAAAAAATAAIRLGERRREGERLLQNFCTHSSLPSPSPFSKRRARLHYYYTTTNSTIGCKQARLQGFEERLALLQLHSPVLTGSPSFFPEFCETTCVEPSLLSLWASVASCTWCEKE